MSELTLSLKSVGDVSLLVRRGLDSAYLGVTNLSGVQLTSMTTEFPHFQRLAEFFTAYYNLLQVVGRRAASESTPMHASGENLDSFIEFFEVPLTSPETAQLTISVTSSASYTITAGDQWASIAGLQYVTDASVAFVGAESKLLNITAVAIGSLYNLSTQDTVSLVSPVGEISDLAPVVEILVVGQDPSDTEDKQEALQDHFSSFKDTGSIAWYQSELRSLSADIGVVFAHPQGRGESTMALYPLLELDAETLALAPWTVIKPTQGQVDGWTATLDDASRRRATDRPFVLIPDTPAINITLSVIPNTVDNQTLAENSLNRRFAEERPTPIGQVGRDVLETYEIRASEVSSAVGSLASISDHTITLIEAGTDATDANVPVPGATATSFTSAGQVLVVGVVTFV